MMKRSGGWCRSNHCSKTKKERPLGDAQFFTAAESNPPRDRELLVRQTQCADTSRCD